MIVRKAAAVDLPGYLEMGKKFHESSPMHGVIDFDDNGYSNFYLSALHDENIGMWLAEDDGNLVGIVGAIIYPLYFNPGAKVVQELWWWVSPESRGSGVGRQMFSEIEEWATVNNASAIFMIALQNEHLEKMEKLYDGAGFRPLERTYIKEVK